MPLHPSALSRRFEALLFDLGSTLIYFDGDLPAVMARADQAMFRVLVSAGLRLDAAIFLRQFSARMAAYFAERDTEFIEYTTRFQLSTLLAEWGYSHPTEAVLRAALAARYTISRACWHAESDALSTLQTLQAQGYRLGLISNAGDDADVQALVDKIAARPYFDFVLTSAAVGYRKPNPRIFQAALDRWAVAPNQAAMVGDMLGADILGAQNLGIFAIWVTRRADTAANRAHADTIHPDATIATLSDLPALLGRCA
jgi:putative hydrolase of the HAD superfamily